MPRARRVRGQDARPTAHEAFIDNAGDDAEDQHPLSDEEDDTRTKEKLKIIAQDGQLGFSHTKKGFDSRTNFTLDIHGDIFSVEYQLKGSVFNVRLSNGEVLACYVPEKCLLVPDRFKDWCDKQHISKRFTLDFPKPAWAKFIRNMLSNFATSANYKQVEFVECVGFQHHTAKGRGGLSKRSAKDPDLTGIDFHYFRYCFGPKLFFKHDGTVDTDPIHFWFPWLSDKLSCSELLLEPLDFLPSLSYSLEDVIRAYTPGNFWQYIWTMGATISSANAVIIRFKNKQHPSTILIGDKGVGKTFALEACIWSLCGLSDDSKSDPDMDTRTIKATAGMTTNPIPVDDGESVAKEAKLVTSAFDRTKYKTKNGTVQNVSVYMITSNIMNRVERTGDREHIQVFHRYEGGSEEMRACKEAYSKLISSPEIPIGFTINYGRAVLTKEWDDDWKQFEGELEEIMGKKDRTIGCYAIIANAVKYIYDNNKPVFESLGRTWEEMMTVFLPGRFRDAVRATHPEISRPDLVLKNFLKDLARILAGLSISERKRKVCMAESLKTRTGRLQAVIGIRLSEPLFQVVNGTALEYVQKIIGTVGGVPKQSTRKFLSDSAEVSDDEPGITEDNFAQYNALLWPLKEVESALILKYCQLLGEPNFRHVADVDTPSGFSSALEFSNVLVSDASSSTTQTGGGSSDLLSSTVREGAARLPQDSFNVSIIKPVEVMFCPKCGEILQSKAGRTKHISRCDGTSNFCRADITAYVCDLCGYVAKSARGLTQHKEQGSNCMERERSRTMSRLELSTTNYECPCGKKLSTSQALGSHRRTCTGLTNTGLTNTGLTSTGLTSTGLTSTNHSVVQSNANTTDDSLLCCGRTFANKSALTSHKRSKRHKENVENSTEGTNTKEGPNTTEEEPIEPRGGATAAVLQPQARRSARSSVSMYAEGLAPQDLANISSPGPSQFVCLCKKSYSSENGLKTHKRFCKLLKADPRNVDDSSLVCPKCQASFQSKNSLGLHILSHY